MTFPRSWRVPRFPASCCETNLLVQTSSRSRCRRLSPGVGGDSVPRVGTSQHLLETPHCLQERLRPVTTPSQSRNTLCPSPGLGATELLECLPAEQRGTRSFAGSARTEHRKLVAHTAETCSSSVLEAGFRGQGVGRTGSF